MTCSRCKYQFCWLCGANCSEAHFMNPIYPCAGKIFSTEPPIFTKYPILFYLRFLLLILFPAAILLYDYIFIAEEISEFFNEKKLRKNAYLIICTFTALFLNSIVYMTLVIAICISPIIVSFIILFISEKWNKSLWQQYEEFDSSHSCLLIFIIIFLLISSVPSVILIITLFVIFSPFLTAIICLLQTIN